MIELENVVKQYKEKLAVNNLNLEIKDNELFSLLGVNGAGKTTTIKMITSLIEPTSGEIYVFGKNLKENREEIKELMNVSPQETAVAPNLSVYENLDFMAGVYMINNKKEKIEELISLFKLEEIRNQKARTLSGGWQRRLSIAIALINEPKVLFLDEPTLGLDVLARRELWEVIRNLKNKITILLTTHYMEEAEELSDRVGVMVNGNLLCVDTPKGLIERTNAKNFEDAFVKIATGGTK